MIPCDILVVLIYCYLNLMVDIVKVEFEALFLVPQLGLNHLRNLSQVIVNRLLYQELRSNYGVDMTLDPL
jgi:hypothetical protein